MPTAAASKPKTKTQTAPTTRPSAKRAVITSGGKQYLVSEGQELEVEMLGDKPASHFEALLVIDGEKVSVGLPVVDGAKVGFEILEPEVKSDKVVAIRYKAKKRVHKRRGHRQRLARIRIIKIS